MCRRTQGKARQAGEKNLSVISRKDKTVFKGALKAWKPLRADGVTLYWAPIPLSLLLIPDSFFWNKIILIIYLSFHGAVQ